MALVVVQRGHVPRTSGATGAPGEQAFARAAADRVKAHVVGHQVRIIDADEPDDRYRGDWFVSLHYDSSASPSARGASVGYQTPEGRQFATAWKQHYQAAGWSGGFRGDNYTSALAAYYGVRRAVSVGNRAAFIAEAGFHSSPADAALLAAPGGPDRVGRAVAAALAGHPVPAPSPTGGFLMALTDKDQKLLFERVHNISMALQDGPSQKANYLGRDIRRDIKPGVADLLGRYGSTLVAYHDHRGGEPVFLTDFMTKTWVPHGGPLHQMLRLFREMEGMSPNAVRVDRAALDQIPTVKEG